MHYRVALYFALCLAGGFVLGEEPGAPAIPDLAWEERSDWINVKNDGAKGDGVADDTAAIQKAFERIKGGAIMGATLYFPPGKYRITKTIEPPEPHPSGSHLAFSMIGHGRSTIMVWDGEAGGRMFWTKHGMPQSRFVGFTWDGRGKAAVGFDHTSIKYFETEVRHQHEAYQNFTEAGIRVGLKTSIATAETVYDNCLFTDCGVGTLLISHNVLDHTFRNCEFRRCGTAIASTAGTNFYAMDCHFEQSGVTDIRSHGEAGSSIRRCTSQGSAQFVIHQSSVSPLTIQDCHVEGWKNPACAILESGAPVMMFDCVFTHPPSKEAPLKVEGDMRVGHIFLSNNKAEGCSELLNGSTNDFRKACVFEIPAGALGGTVKSAGQRFLKSSMRIPGKVFDARRDFGAKGDGLVDDTKAIQATIDAAKAHGKSAIAYVPRGHYVISETLTLSGSDYFFGGSGYLSVLAWKKGITGGTLLAVKDPERITVENISASEENNGFDASNEIDILQTSSGKPTSVCYDRVMVYGIYKNKPLVKGLQLKGLGKNDVVVINEVEGNIHCIDSADATILIRLSYEGSIVAEGKSTNRSGFLGGNVRLGTNTDPGLWIRDNHSIVMSDFYTESGSHFIRLDGDGNQLAGRVTVQGAKFEIAKNENNAVEVDNYKGELCVGPYVYYVGNPLHKFVQKGESPFELIVWGGSFYQSKPDFKLAKSASVILAGSGSPNDTTETAIKDVNAGKALPILARALDDFRRLGAVNSKQNSAD
jgi:hypothetical protein